jgi:hypothetical protein
MAEDPTKSGFEQKQEQLGNHNQTVGQIYFLPTVAPYQAVPSMRRFNKKNIQWAHKV